MHGWLPLHIDPEEYDPADEIILLVLHYILLEPLFCSEAAWPLPSQKGQLWPWISNWLGAWQWGKDSFSIIPEPQLI